MNEIKKEQIVEEVVVSDTICAVPWMHLKWKSCTLLFDECT